jgi:peptidoglycan/LPS O-acetylase OafA/YrhL
MNKNTSTYLDAARFLAALMVFVGHTEEIWAPGMIPWAANSGTPSVGIFFVLSGFVIGYTVDRNEPDARSYFLSRAARIYSVVVPVLTVTMLLDIVGRYLSPDVYVPLGLGSWQELGKLLISLTFVNQAWHWNLTPGSDGPFWSLAYEVPYYLVFGLWHFSPAPRWRLIAIPAMVAAGPYIALLFLLWLLGLACYHLCRSVALTQAQGRTLLLLSLLASAPLAFGRLPYYAQFFAAAIPFAISIVGFSFSALAISHWAKPIRWIAGATFTLYLLHYPLGCLLHVLLPPTWPLPVRWLVICGVVLPSSFLLAQFTERRKKSWHRALASMVSYCASRIAHLKFLGADSTAHPGSGNPTTAGKGEHDT